VKNQEERLLAMLSLQLPDNRDIRGRWRSCLEGINEDFKGEIYLEIGCGRGHFLAALGEANPSDFYLGVEGRGSVALRAMELIKENGLNNVLFIPEFILDVNEHFAQGELSGIYLNFSDPWPKARHAKRRLTHRNYLRGYSRALKPDGFIEVKTDSKELFEFTLKECGEIGLAIEEISNDLHKSHLSARLVTTQYENRFRLLGKPIYYCRITK
jgi:tRNA (guanine-N7-)-methyltransferase